MPMGTRSTGQGPIAPPTDFAGRPLTTPFTPRPALPQQSGSSAGQGRWAGARSQLAYERGMMQGIGLMEQPNVPRAGLVQAMPTSSQITNTQTAPRADTTAQADALGLPSPNPLAVPAQSDVAPSVTVNRANAAPHIPPVTFTGYNLPSLVTAQYGKTGQNQNSDIADANGPKEAMRESRADLLQQLPPESRKEARRLTNAQLREKVRAEQQVELKNLVREITVNSPSEAESGVVKSVTDFEEKESIDVATRRGRFAGTGGEVRRDAVQEPGSEGRDAGAIPAGLGRQGGRPSEASGDIEPARRAGNAGDLHEVSARNGRQEKNGARATSVKIPNRDAEPVTYEIVEADEVQASHLPEYSFEKNPRYGLENERRYHDEPASQRKVLENAARLDSDFLLKDSVDANNGAPVVDQDGNVLGGNGRVMSTRQAYQTGGEAAEAYRTALRERAEELGMNPANVDAMRRPMLIRRLDKARSREERQALVTAMNDSFTDSKNARASGKTRGDRLSRSSMEMLSEGLKDAETLRQYFDEPKSADTVERLIRDGVIQSAERNAYVSGDGLLNPDGKRVVEEALRGRIARHYDALASLPADMVAKIDAIIPSVLIAEQVGSPWDITEHLRDAVDLMAEYKGSGAKEPGVFLKQVNMVTGKTPEERYSPSACQIFKLAQESKKADFAQRFRKYTAQAQCSSETNALPGSALSQPEAGERFLGITSDTKTSVKENDHADLNSRRSMERDSQGNTAQNKVGGTSLSFDGKQDRGVGNAGGRQAGTDVSAPRGERISGHTPSAAGVRSDTGVGEETPPVRQRAAGSEHGDRSRSDGEHGLDVQRDREEAVGKTAERSADQQIASGDAHLAEVRKALPNLYPGQQEDVVFAEKRFCNGQGVLFTNGTGTGKTGLALGVIARLAKAGRQEILIAVPADKIASDWITLGKALGVSISKLVDTKNPGKGISITTHANMAHNDALFSRQWDLLVIDEAHKLSSSQQGNATDLLQRLRGLALHPGGLFTRAEKTGRGPELSKEITTLREKEEKELTPKEKGRLDTLLAELRTWQNEVQSEVESAQGSNRANLTHADGKKPGVLLLSATPFAYEKSIDYAEGFLFDYPAVTSSGGYNQPSSYEQFMIDHFGYRMRYGKLTRPDAEVDSSLMQREFNSWLKKQGSLSSRSLDTPFDYDRRFILTKNAIGQKIDEGLDFLREHRERYSELLDWIEKRFDHLAKRYLLEAIKARESIGMIRENVQKGRKVVVFHQFNKGGGFNPFDVSGIES